MWRVPSEKATSKKWSHQTSLRFGQNLYACGQPITRGVAAMDSSFDLVRTLKSVRRNQEPMEKPPIN